jgi:hypothetical protein
MLELDVVDSNDLKMQMVTTLQSTTAGKRMYAELCDRQIALRELVSEMTCTRSCVTDRSPSENW